MLWKSKRTRAKVRGKPQIPVKQNNTRHWPGGKLPDPLIPGSEGIEENQTDIEAEKSKAKGDDGFDEWSVSWP